MFWKYKDNYGIVPAVKKHSFKKTFHGPLGTNDGGTQLKH